jgi:ABC-type lipoprotein release transport system permease subunit
VLVSRTLIEMYNASFAPSHGMPRVGAVQEALLRDTMRAMRFKIALGESILENKALKLADKPDTIEGQIIGISDKAMPIGMTVPIGYVKRWNARFNGPESARSYSSIVVDLRDRADLATFVPWIKKNGYEQEDSQAESVALVIKIVTALFLVIAFTICFISAVNISHTFFMLVSERRKEIGLLRAIGASRFDVWKILLAEAATVGVVAGSIGCALALGAAKMIDLLSAKKLPDFPFKPTTYFQFSPALVACALGFAALFCILGAALPARKAARIHPAQALLG